MAQRIIVGISGASGIVYGVRALELLRAAGVETHLVMTKSAELTLHHELDMDLASIKDLSPPAREMMARYTGLRDVAARIVAAHRGAGALCQ